MPDYSGLTPQQAKDVDPFFTLFPKTKIDDDLSPTILVELFDAEDDPVEISIDLEGNIHLDTDQYSHLVLSPSNIDALKLASTNAKILWQMWLETPSGKAWSRDI